MVSAVHYSSGKDNWGTPDDLFRRVHDVYRFDIDLAADETNHKVPLWYGPGGAEPDALAVGWGTDTRWQAGWLNPPYSRGLQARFIEKAAHAGQHGKTIVALLPARTDTRVFHDYIWDDIRGRGRVGVQVQFMRGRVRFVGAQHGAPFPSMLVTFGGGAHGHTTD